MELEEAKKELKNLQMAFGFYRVDSKKEYNYLRDEEPDNYKTALAIEIVLQTLEDKDKEIEKQNKIIDIMAWSMTHEDIPTDEYCKIRTMGCEFMGGSTYECKECVKEYFRKRCEYNDVN